MNIITNIVISFLDAVVLYGIYAVIIVGGTWFIESRFFEWLLELFFDI